MTRRTTPICLAACALFACAIASLAGCEPQDSTTDNPDQLPQRDVPGTTSNNDRTPTTGGGTGGSGGG